MWKAMQKDTGPQRRSFRLRNYLLQKQIHLLLGLCYLPLQAPAVNGAAMYEVMPWCPVSKRPFWKGHSLETKLEHTAPRYENAEAHALQERMWKELQQKLGRPIPPEHISSPKTLGAFLRALSLHICMLSTTQTQQWAQHLCAPWLYRAWASHCILQKEGETWRARWWFWARNSHLWVFVWS